MTDRNNKLKNLPASPGVYLFRDAKGKILYIGKAKSLRSRVRSYFQSAGRYDAKTSRMLDQVDDFDLMVTASEVEALILEANLVHEHKPKYNINLKDDKHYPYIKVTKEPFPRMLIVRRIEKDGATYFGPYTNAKGMRQTVAFLSRTFMIRTCGLVIPHPKGKTYKVCLDYHINRCGGPCEGFQSEKEYAELISSAVMVLSGKSKKLIERLEERMTEASDAMEFEEAARLRDQIEAIRSVMIRQNVDVGEVVDRDIIAVAREDKDAVAVVMQLREGVLIGRQDFQLSADPEDTDREIASTFMKQYYNHQPNMPSEIFLPVEIDEVTLMETWLSGIKGTKVRIATPRIGEKVRLLDLAAKNARLLMDELMIRKRQFSERTSKMVVALKDELGLPKSPRTIACFDISNTGETDAVGSSVYFENARPKKSQYRHFKIKGTRGQDDFRMMREVIGRYFFRINEEKTTPPDLIVVDGGKGQLNAALAELKYLRIEEQQVISLAKRLEEIFLPGRRDSVVISRSSPALLLLKQVRDEAHRFAVTYNRKVRSKRTVKSVLSDLKGIGPAKQQALLRRFGSVDRIRKATAEEIAEIKGFSLKSAERLLSELRKR